MTPNHAITRPYEHDCTPGWDQRTPENQKACMKIKREIEKRSNRVYVIRFSMAGPPVNGVYPTKDYPRIFITDDDAWDWMAVDKDFKWPAGARSCSVQRVNL